MRTETKKLKYKILTINSATTVTQFTHRVINPILACDLIFDITSTNKSTSAQFSVYASQAIPVTIKIVDGSGTSILAVAEGYTVINTEPDGTPIIGVTGTGSSVGGPGFLTEVIYTSTNMTLDAIGAHVVVDTANVVISADSVIEVEPTFVYVSNTSSGTITFEGAAITTGSKVAFVYSDAKSKWEVFMRDSGTSSTVSHLIGFGTVIDLNDHNISHWYMDVFPLVSGTVVDTSKYNLFFNDGSPAWKIVPTGVEVNTVTAVDVVLTTPS